VFDEGLVNFTILIECYKILKNVRYKF
jgi:hypothetical protein